MSVSRSSRTAFLIVGDADFFPGVLAATASVRVFHPGDEVWIIDNHLQRIGLTAEQHVALQRMNAVIVPASALAKQGRKLAAWELKAYAAEFLASQCGLLVGLDADAVLCAPLFDVLGRAWEKDVFLGGLDGCPEYGEEYCIYGIQPPIKNERYMSTSLYLCRTSAPITDILATWAECCAKSVFGGTGKYPGHGDQGVLNAIIFSRSDRVTVEVMENDLWSQHGVYWQRPLELRAGRLFNLTLQTWQRAIHCGGTEKFWRPQHATMLPKFPHALANYLWFLHMLETGIHAAGCHSRQLLREWPHLVQDISRYVAEMEALRDSRCTE